MQTEDMCPATACLKVMKEKKLAFDGITEGIEIIGINTCGGRPGKKAITRATEMVNGDLTQLYWLPAFLRALL